MTAVDRLRQLEQEIEELQRKLGDRELGQDEKTMLQARLAILRRQRVSASIAAKRELFEKRSGSI